MAGKKLLRTANEKQKNTRSFKASGILIRTLFYRAVTVPRIFQYCVSFVGLQQPFPRALSIFMMNFGRISLGT